MFYVIFWLFFDHSKGVSLKWQQGICQSSSHWWGIHQCTAKIFQIRWVPDVLKLFFRLLSKILLYSTIKIPIFPISAWRWSRTTFETKKFKWWRNWIIRWLHFSCLVWKIGRNSLYNLIVSAIGYWVVVPWCCSW